MSIIAYPSTNVKGFFKKVFSKLFFYSDREPFLARGAAHGMLANNSFQPEGVFAMGAFAVEMRPPVAYAEEKTAQGHKELAEKTAEGKVFTAALGDVA